MNERMEILANIPLFSYMNPDELSEAQKLFNEEVYNKGDTICQVGEEGDTFYIVLSGQLEVWYGPDASQLVAFLGPGDFFGEMALVLGGPRTATITVAQRSRLLSLTKEAFTQYFLNNTKALEYFSRVMCQRLAATASGADLEKTTTVITVVGRAGLKGKTLVATALASLLKSMTTKDVILIQVCQSVSEKDKLLRDVIEISHDHLWHEVRFREDDAALMEVLVDPTQSQMLYGERIAALIERLGDDFEYFVIDLGSGPEALINSVGDFSDILIRIVDRVNLKDSKVSQAQEKNGTRFCTYEIINLFNRGSMTIPINHCEPFVLPHAGTLSARNTIKILGSPVSVPLSRLARKILGQTVGLALGGGAAFGLAHLGVLQVLEENDIPIDLLSGCSMGSMIACGYAAGVPTGKLIDMAHTLGAVNRVIRVVDPTLTRPGLLGGDRIKTVFNPYLGARQTFQDLVLPCRVIATDIVTGERVEIYNGRLEDAFRASSSVPVVLAPVKQGDHVLVDGGVCDPVPAETVRDMGADIIVAVNVVPPPRRGVEMLLSRIYRQMNPLTYLGMNEDIPNMFDITMSAMQILQYELGNFKAISADVRINPDVSDFTWVDFTRSREIIDKGIEATERALPAIKRVIAERSK